MDIAYSYVRFSSKKQELGASLIRQVELARRYAAEHKLDLQDKSFKDLGISAWKGKNAAHGELRAFLTAVDEGKIPKGASLLVESLDRLSRAAPLDALDLIREIVKRGIKIVTVTDGRVYSAENIEKDIGVLMSIVLFVSRAHEESNTKSNRVGDKWERKRASGAVLTSRGPAWMKLNADRAWELIPEKVAVIQKIFALAASGLGGFSIARRLNGEHVPVMASAKLWQPELVLSILRNRAVIGTFTSRLGKDENGKRLDPVLGYYPAIIDEKVFNTVQEQVSNRTGRSRGKEGKRVANLFTGLLRCECGDGVRYVSSNQTKTYLRCLTAYACGNCDAPQMPYNPLEHRLLWWILQFEGIQSGMSEMSTHDPAQVYRDALADKVRAYESFMDVLGQGGAQSSMPRMQARAAKYEQEIAELENLIRKTVPLTPSDQVIKESAHLFSRHFELVDMKIDESTDEEQWKYWEELFELRTKLQGAMHRLIDKIVLLKKFHLAEPLSPLSDAVQAAGTMFAEVAVYGPIVEMVNAGRFKNVWKRTEDGGIIQDYRLPDYAPALGRRRKQLALV